MPSTTFTVSSGSERPVRIYPSRGARTSSGNTSAISPATSSTQSFSSSTGSDGWTEVDPPYEDDGIEPSDSASRSRHPNSRRHTTEARPAPVRRHSSRRVVEHDEPPHHHSSHRHRSSRHRRSESRRVPSDESASTVASADDHPYNHYGVSNAAYPPPGYRNAPPPQQRHSGYPPSMTSAPGYPDPYQQALVQMPPPPAPDPFGYPSHTPSQHNNPFSPGAQSQGNPFSPMQTSNATSYFPTEHHAPPVQHHAPSRPPGPSRPQSMYSQSSSGGYGQELMAPYHHQAMPGMPPGMPGMPYGGYGMPGAPGMPGMPPMHPGMQGMAMQGMPGMMPGMPGYPPVPYMYPPSQAASPAPPPPPAPKEEKKEEKKEPEVKIVEKVVEVKDDSMSKEMENLRELIKKHEEERVAREKAMIAKAEAEAAAAAAKKAREEEEKKKKEEIAAASKKAKEEAEKAAAEAAKKAKEAAEAAAKAAKEEAEAAAKAAKEEADAKLAELVKKQEEAEKAKAELEAEVAKNKPIPDMQRAPIKFKDAVGRKFSFPWHLCKTWKGMESLIKQAFLHVDVIGQHVQEGHYDLTGPDGEIILPQVWDTMIKPDWEISMHMWPMPEPEAKKEKKKKEKEKADEDEVLMELPPGYGGPGGPGGPDPFAGMGLEQLLAGFDGGAGRPKGGDKPPKASKPSKKAPKAVSPPQPAPPPMNFPPAPPPGPSNLSDFASFFPDGLPGGGGPVVMGDDGKKRPNKSSKTKSKEISGFGMWLAGGRPANKKR